jgi:hypothetical protein
MNCPKEMIKCCFEYSGLHKNQQNTLRHKIFAATTLNSIVLVTNCWFWFNCVKLYPSFLLLFSPPHSSVTGSIAVTNNVSSTTASSSSIFVVSSVDIATLLGALERLGLIASRDNASAAEIVF